MYVCVFCTYGDLFYFGKRVYVVGPVGVSAPDGCRVDCPEVVKFEFLEGVLDYLVSVLVIPVCVEVGCSDEDISWIVFRND